MTGYNYFVNGKYVDLFHITNKAREILKKFKSYEKLEHQRCTDRIALEDFPIFQAAIKGLYNV